MKILAVDTALGACSAALLEDDRVLARRYEAMERGHAEALAPMVQAVMEDAGVGFSNLDRLGVTVGPGTFTGQRVGLAFMRGLRLALGKPLLGVTSLAAMAEQARAEAGLSAAAAIHDARRDEVYLEIVGESAPPDARLETFETARARLEGGAMDIVLAGTAAGRMASALRVGGKAVELSGIVAPDSVWVARLAALLVPTGDVPRPLYLRAPDAKLPSGRS
ncbi:MAG: tRNA (adenosine(37)-N6)-threonylcarbamoyltransferase complex dimerization subunit type 1 TsaB [Alphaproteobacteria bacterium]|nr:tRNA (adenosine(37)-N6)-threonylcarbamoyltransferase complex dimerization subunit type 1 TsaB [Alphaproteobacteria bacterium]MDE2109582.1 tRNA (adenosine(37)-N6)-threonylcarbamoyltransferase complex dimerization subunit type 1 TsaB [Alphaproteobacteria bacterium]MDE2493367.1 tRNA (adenosine(37)-N6)-threonylcarbamoyltransferase complex dimerization subunit type 1 TsaB [Alphaproteobacteria bacterium]